MLCLPRKVTLMIDPRDTWNVIYNARNNRHHPSTSPNAVPATKNDSHHWSSWHMKRHLQCAEQQASPSNLTKYCACHAKWLSWLMSVTHDTSFTMRGATDLILQHHQVLRLPRKMTRIIYPRDIWNVIYNARRNRHHPPTSPNAAPATKNDAHHWLSSHMKRHLQCAEQQASPSNLTKYSACHAKLHSKIKEKFAENSWSVISNARPIRAWSDHDPNMIRPWNCKTEPVHSQSLLFPPRQRILYWKLQHFALRLSTQISPNTAPATKSDAPRSPNTAPATQHDSHDWCPSPITRHLQCAQQQASPSNLTKCCPCHEKWCASLIVVAYETSFTMRGATGITLQPHQILRLPRKIALQNQRKICRKQLKRQFQCAADSSMIRPWSEHDPNMIRAWTRHLAPARSPRLLFALRRRILYWKLQHFALRAPAIYPDFTEYCACHKKWRSKITKYCACHATWLSWLMSVTHDTSFTMRGATSITLQPHQMLPLPRKMMRIIDCRRIWNVIYNARSHRHRPPTSPNTAPATQNDSHDWSSSHMERHLQCAEQQASPHQILRLPRKSALENLSEILRERLKRQFQCAADSTMIRTWSEHELVISHPPVRRGYFSRFGDAFCIENYNISRSGYLLKFHRILRLPRKVTLRHHQILRLPRKVTLRHHQMLRLPRKVTLRHHQILRLPRKVTLRHHQIPRLPRKVRLLLNCYWTELLLSCYWAVTKLLLSCYWTVTELLLTLNWPVTELLLNWAVTELLLNWTVAGLSFNCYWTDLLLNWAVTQLLLDCYWTVTELTCYWTELLLNCYWTVTELTCYSAVTELLLCTATWTVTVLDTLHF